MIVSQSEVLAMVRKAAIGSGLSAGVAIDLARAAVWLCGHGFDGVGCALTSLADQPVPALARRAGTGEPHRSHWPHWVASNARAALDARLGVDLVVSGAAPDGVRFEDCDVPLIVLGTAAVASIEHPRTFEIRSTDVAEPMGDADDSVRCVVDRGVAWGGVPPAVRSMTLVAVEAGGCDSLPVIERVAEVAVEPRTWKRAGAAAALTYVPSTAASRAAGAGAGLTDND